MANTTLSDALFYISRCERDRGSISCSAYGLFRQTDDTSSEIFQALEFTFGVSFADFTCIY